MFCSKCHTEIREEDIKYCPRCGQAIGKNRTNNHFYFKSSLKTKNEHENQYEYSKDFSNVKDDTLDTHQEQYEYSKNYSDIKKENLDEHNTQYNYSKDYSNVTKDKAEEHENQYNYSAKYSDVNTMNITSDEDYVKAYIKYNYNLIKKQKINIGALIFGPFYCIYRKMYFLGIILLLIESSFLFTIGDHSLFLYRCQTTDESLLVWPSPRGELEGFKKLVFKPEHLSHGLELPTACLGTRWVCNVSKTLQRGMHSWS